MSPAPPALAVALASVVGVGCAAGHRTYPLLEGSFSAGVRVPRDAEETPLVAGSVAAGAVHWWTRDPEGPLRQFLGAGATVLVSWFDLERVDLGVDVILAPPRKDRRTGFQFRLGPRLATDGEHGGGSFAAEWYDAWLGGLFAEAQYDLLGREAAFLVGARVNLFFPVTYVKLSVEPID